ncbi:MAG TPA: NAD(P)-binding domain-containing protein [Chitinophagaceae bacterium]|nr:NAD(P)-binding domain-containing protein [Chitinophagaceae bacterium]
MFLEGQQQLGVHSSSIFYKVDIVVIGAGQAGLSAAYYLKKQGIEAGKGFVVTDDESGPGGAWQHRWDALTLNRVNGINDLPGMSFAKAVDSKEVEIQANIAVPAYYEQYEKKFELPVIRPLRVKEVVGKEDRFLIKTNGVQFSARGLINATGTWKTPKCPKYPGWELFKGRQLHTGEYKDATAFRGEHVIVVGGGISAIQLLDEISKVTTTTWVTRRPPEFSEEKFTPEKGRAAVAKVECRVREGLPPQSVVSVTGLPLTPEILAMRKRGVLKRKPMFDKITTEGVQWKDGTRLRADVILWNTGFRHSLDHLASLNLANEKGGITMSGKLATQVKKNPRIHLTGYGPSASTIGANRAGRVAANELVTYLRLK